jgi:predicted alpha/beta-fold hydrolase
MMSPLSVIASSPAASTPPAVELHVLPHGGHLGFLGWDGSGGCRWAERLVVDWLLAEL